jgi:hypothetical protein
VVETLFSEQKYAKYSILKERLHRVEVVPLQRQRDRVNQVEKKAINHDEHLEPRHGEKTYRCF